MTRGRSSSFHGEGFYQIFRDSRVEKCNQLSNVQNALLVGLLCVFLCGPLALMVSDKLAIELPPWLSNVDAAYLSGSSGGGWVHPRHSALMGLKVVSFK